MTLSLSNLSLVGVVLATDNELPPIRAAGYEYVIAGNGLFIRAEDSRMEAMVPVAPATLRGLATVEPYARLKTPRIPQSHLWAVYQSAIAHLPNEAMYQHRWDGYAWRIARPAQASSATSVAFADGGETVVDLHSHAGMNCFFSAVDDADELGFRFYVVIGRLTPFYEPITSWPGIVCRVGVYGHHWPVPADVIFEGCGPFIEIQDKEGIDAEPAY